MMVRIICINKDHGFHDNPHVAISRLGWVDEKTGEVGGSSRIEMYNFLVGGGVAYVSDALGNRAYLYPQVSPFGTPYVQTQADGTPFNNLLFLPECPY